MIRDPREAAASASTTVDTERHDWLMANLIGMWGMILAATALAVLGVLALFLTASPSGLVLLVFSAAAGWLAFALFLPRVRSAREGNDSE
jgi:hypothetical protein